VNPQFSFRANPGKLRRPFIAASLAVFLFIPMLVASACGNEEAALDSSELPPVCTELAQSTGEGQELFQALMADRSADSYARLGQFYLERGDVDCASRAFQSAVSMDDQLWKAHYGLGLA